MKVAAVVTDLMLYSRIESAARVAGVELVRVDRPHAIPPATELVLVDWSAREPGWTARLQSLSGARIILFGPHVDLEAHASAREAMLGPMMARSKLLSSLGELMGGDPQQAGSGG